MKKHPKTNFVLVGIFILAFLIGTIVPIAIVAWQTQDGSLKKEAKLLANYTLLLFENGSYEYKTLKDALKYGCGCEHWFEAAVAEANNSDLFRDALLVVCISKNVIADPNEVKSALNSVRHELEKRGISFQN